MITPALMFSVLLLALLALGSTYRKGRPAASSAGRPGPLRFHGPAGAGKSAPAAAPNQSQCCF